MADKMYEPLLPRGIHDLAWSDVEQLCAGDFPASRTRGALLAGLRRFVERLHKVGASVEIWVDGSFVTKKENPEDVDLVVLMAGGNVAKFAEREEGLLNMVRYRRDRIRKVFCCDAYLCYTDNTDRVSEWRNWFESDRDGNPKGIVCLSNF